MIFKLPAPYKKLVDYIKAHIAKEDRIYLQAHLPETKTYALAGFNPKVIFVTKKGINLLLDTQNGNATCQERFTILWEPKTKLWVISRKGQPSVKVNTLAGVNTLMHWHFN